MTMIKNQKQLAFSKEQIEKFEKTLIEIEETKGDKNPILFKLEKDALNSLLNDLKTEVEEFENILNKQITSFTNLTLKDLPKMLIYCRLAEGISQTDLGKRMGKTQQQINRHENSDYQSTSLARIIEIVDSLKVNLKIDVTISKPEEPLGDESNFDLPDNVPITRITDFGIRVRQKGLMPIC